MFGLLDELKKPRIPITIGIVGIGSIGKGMLLQSMLTPGIECVAIADIVLEQAVRWAEHFGREYRIVNSLEQLHSTVYEGKLAITDDGDLVARNDLIEVFVEATNSLFAGGRTAITALEHNKHVVMMNYEADLMFGPYLMKEADKRDLVYTVCDGDQPTVITRIVDEMQFMGFKLVMAGNIKGYLDRYSDPTSIVPEADKRNLNYKMCTSYADGTKLCVEMAVVANGLGLRTGTPGMFGPPMNDISEIFDHFNFEDLWDGETGLVDYVLGAKPKGGVFAIGYSDHPYQEETLAWLPPELGPGPFYLFYKPFHLCHFESMASVAEAGLHKKAILQPRFGFQTNVYAYAKRDLTAGELLDGFGGYLCYGLIENCSENDIQPGLPMCLAENVRLKRNIPRDSKVHLSDIENEAGDFCFDLHQKACEVSDEFRVSV